MQIRVIFAAVAAVAILAGCAAGNDRLRNLNSQQIAEQIVDTQTNRQDVVALLGEPNTTQQEADGTKVLEYTWVRSRPSAKNFIPLNPIDEFPTTKKSLRVWIDDNDRVVKHEYSGVFYVYRKPLIGSNSTHSMRPLTQEELDGLADLVVFVVAEQAPLFRLEQPVPLEEHGVDGVVILPRQLCRDGQDLAVRFRFLGGFCHAFASKELVEAELQRVGQQRQKLQVGAADIALPL
mgnify:CR=1 FL=1